MTVRAKFYVSNKIESPAYGEEGGVVTQVKLAPVYESFPDKMGNACDENKMFGEATPCGEISMHIHNRAAADRFETGKAYYVDFSPAD